MIKRRRVSAAAGVIALVSALAACGAKAHSPMPAASAGASSVTAQSIAAVPISSMTVPQLSGESGTELTAGSNQAPPYEVFITVTVTSRSNEVASASGMTEYEAALVQIHGESGSYPYSPKNFNFVSASGGLYLPLAGADASRFGSALGVGTVTTGHDIDGYIVFSVPAGGGVVQLEGPLGPRMAWHARR